MAHLLVDLITRRVILIIALNLIESERVPRFPVILSKIGHHRPGSEAVINVTIYYYYINSLKSYLVPCKITGMVYRRKQDFDTLALRRLTDVICDTRSQRGTNVKQNKQTVGLKVY